MLERSVTPAFPRDRRPNWGAWSFLNLATGVSMSLGMFVSQKMFSFDSHPYPCPYPYYLERLSRVLKSRLPLWPMPSMVVELYLSESL